MNENKKMNVLVLGISGAGKSTLIKSVSGISVTTGIGEGNTQNINVYESDNWPIRFIDTKGFEYSIRRQLETIRQVKKYTKQQLTKDNNITDLGIDAVWYCIEGTSRRTFSYNIDLMFKAIKGWKNIPIFAVITKSYSEKDIPENIEAIKTIFAEHKNVNLKAIIPVVAEEYSINDEIKVSPMGIEDLCLQTLDCLDEAKKINKNNLNRMILNQKRFLAHGLVVAATTSAATIGAVSVIPFSDSVILVPLEASLTKSIFKIYKIKFSNELIDNIIGATTITFIAKEILKIIPLAGNVANGVVAGVVVCALGESIIAASEAIQKGTINPEKVNEILDFISEKMKSNKFLNKATNYLKENANNLQNKSSKEILTNMLNAIEKN